MTMAPVASRQARRPIPAGKAIDREGVDPTSPRPFMLS